MAGLRQCAPQFARRIPAIERGRTRPRPAKLDDDLDRPLLAELDPSTLYRELRKRSFKQRRRVIDTAAGPKAAQTSCVTNFNGNRFAQRRRRHVPSLTCANFPILRCPY